MNVCVESRSTRSRQIPIAGTNGYLAQSHHGVWPDLHRAVRAASASAGTSVWSPPKPWRSLAQRGKRGPHETRTTIAAAHIRAGSRKHAGFTEAQTVETDKCFGALATKPSHASHDRSLEALTDLATNPRLTSYASRSSRRLSSVIGRLPSSIS